jgi:hypothetical protein
LSKSLKLLTTEGITFDERLGLHFLKNNKVLHLTKNSLGMFVDFTRDNEVALKDNGNSYILGSVTISGREAHFTKLATNVFVQVKLDNSYGLSLPDFPTPVTYSELVNNKDYMDLVTETIEKFFSLKGLKISVMRNVILGKEQTTFDLFQLVPGTARGVFLITVEHGITSITLKTNRDSNQPVLSLMPLHTMVGQI